jgi:hypothetical protein
MPIESRTSIQQSMVSLFTSIKVGVEKPKSRFDRGDVAFLASNGLLCIFLKNVQSERPLNPVGKVDGGIEVLEALRTGAVIRLTQLEHSGEEKIK